MTDEKYSFIIPCYNSGETVFSVVTLLVKEMNKLGRSIHEVVLVNDCSPDGNATISALRDLSKQYEFVKVINLAKNTGQHNAIMAGLRNATGNVFIGLDDDLQTHPSQLDKLFSTYEKGYDVVYGYYPKKKHSMFRNVGSHINSIASRVFMEKPADVKTSSFWIIRKFVRDSVIEYKGHYSYMSGLFLRATHNIHSVPIEHFERKIGKSNYNIKKLISLWSNLICFSVKPIRLAMYSGYLIAAISLIMLLFIVIKKIIEPTIVIGWTSLMSVILLSCGLNLIFLGLVGEYIGRIFLEVNNTPQYVIKEIIMNGSEIQVSKNIDNEGGV